MDQNLGRVGGPSILVGLEYQLRTLELRWEWEAMVT